MSRKKCKRKVYPYTNTLTLAIEGAAMSSAAALDKLRARELSAIETFTKGCATVRDWQDLVHMLNLTETMARGGVGPEALPACQAAELHMIDASRRFTQIGKMGLTGPGIQAMRDLYEYHDLQRQSVCRAEYERAIAKTRDRVRSRAPEVIAL